ncbi:hypothetical protein C8F04DRAFT_955248 [Mycena alexandri]|uniref:SWIM-type domain-containing protein n=1 Tax=Mycena alexandri TaxID=1745969 RepID=A0AAD6SWW5_9AGAR|nr:hypothetical protein C8F04DRAFT_955248 [Mycena alexandri]
MANELEPDFFEVTQNDDGTLTCQCRAFRQTGKTCEHTFGVNLELEYGNVDRYNGKSYLETIRKIRGRAADSEKNNPEKKELGRRAQRRSDRTVGVDLERHLNQVEKNIDPWKSDDGHSDGSTSDDTDGNAEAATTPLHPGRTSGKSKGKKPAKPENEPKRNGPIKFSNPPGPKPGHHSSLLPGTSPAKKVVDEERQVSV